MMKAAVVYKKNDLRIEDLPKPEIPNGSILVKVKACAICGTDLRIYRKGDYRASYPVVVGHEIAGVVADVATGVSSVKKGDRVCVAPGHGCGKCRMCQKGRPNVCTNPFPSLGYKVDGGFEEYFAVPENIFRLGFVNPIPDNLTYDQASLSEIIACCLNAQENSPVNEGDTVLILGCGPAGIIHSQLAKINGAEKVMVAQRTKNRLEMAKRRFDIDMTIAMNEQNINEVVMEQTNGIGVDVIYVCAPNKQAQELATELIAPRGRINFFGGLPKDAQMVKLDANSLHYKEFFIAGASSSLPEHNRKALELLSKRQIDPELLITHRFGLDDISEAFDVAEARTGIKIVVNP